MTQPPAIGSQTVSYGTEFTTSVTVAATPRSSLSPRFARTSVVGVTASSTPEH